MSTTETERDKRAKSTDAEDERTLEEFDAVMESRLAELAAAAKRARERDQEIEGRIRRLEVLAGLRSD